MQILNLSPDETKQFSSFMGHTEKIHSEFYELPVDIFLTPKVSKILLMMEKGSVPAEYKGKSLNEINFDSNLEYAVEMDPEDAESDESDVPGNKTKKHKRRKGWSDQEISAMKNCFCEYINKGTYPSSQKVKDFIKQTKTNRSVPVIKSKIQHLIKLNSK